MRHLSTVATWLLLDLAAGVATAADLVDATRDEAVRSAQAVARPRAPIPPPAVPARPPRTALPTAPPARPAPPPPAPLAATTITAPASPSASSVAVGLGGPELTSIDWAAPGGIPLMLGDAGPTFGAAARGPSGTLRLPWVRGYKMADNQSPWPLDRAFVAFNFYDDVNIGPASSVLRQVRVYREFFGFEKTFLDDRNASVGVRLPLNSITAQGMAPGQNAASTALGDLTVFAKYAFWYDRARGDLAMGGLAVTPNTGPRNFAGAKFARARSPVYFQPFVGYVKTAGPFFLQAFHGINVPTDPHVVTMFYNDVAFGYLGFRAADPGRLISAVVPTMEVHVNTPLNHRGGFTAIHDPGATFDVVDLTFGLNFWLRDRAILSVGFADPVTGPRPFAGEFVAALNVFYGRTPRRLPPPSLGG